MSQTELTLKEIAESISAKVLGDDNQMIKGLATIQDAKEGDLAFLANPAYAQFLEQTKATAVIVSPKLADKVPTNALVMDNPYLGFAKSSALFDPAPSLQPGVHPSATIADSARIGKNVYIGPNVYVGEQCIIEDGAKIEANTVISHRSVIGKDTHLYGNVTLYHDVSLGERCIIHSGAIIGADGFGFAPSEGKWEKIHQIGGVRIGDDVEVGANTTIDRGALGDTQLGDGVKLDNQIQIAHNVEIGDWTAIAACSAIAGSAKIGKNCTIAGCVGIVGHIEICDGVHVTGMTMISKSITEPGSYSSGTGQAPTSEWRKSAARFRQLDEMAKRIKLLEKQIKDRS